MNCLIRGDHLTITSSLKEYVISKINHLEKFDAVSSSDLCRVTMRIQHENHTVEVTIPTSGMMFRAEESAVDMYTAVDLVLDKLERQFRENKDRIHQMLRHREGPRYSINQAVHEAQNDKLEHENLNDIEIARIKKFDLKPMDVEEAILQMELLGHTFFVFTNSETVQVNVVYKRKDGRYGLIESSYRL